MRPTNSLDVLLYQMQKVKPLGCWIQEGYCMFLSCHGHVSKWIYTLWLPEFQGTPCAKQARYLTPTHNHLVRKRTLNHLAKLASLAKWLSARLRTKWLLVRVPLQRRYNRFTFVRKLLAIWQKYREPSFWKVMGSFFISIYKFRNFKNSFATITGLSEL